MTPQRIAAFPTPGVDGTGNGPPRASGPSRLWQRSQAAVSGLKIRPGDRVVHESRVVQIERTERQRLSGHFVGGGQCRIYRNVAGLPVHEADVGDHAHCAAGFDIRDAGAANRVVVRVSEALPASSGSKTRAGST